MAIKKPRTNIAFVLDKSGSMGSVRLQAVNDYNEQVQEVKSNLENQDVFVWLTTFNSGVFEHLSGVHASKLEEAKLEDWVCSGCTAFRDGVGWTIQKIQEARPNPDDDEGFLFIIISDGCENASKNITSAALREMIDSCQSTGKWTFTYLGCSESQVKNIADETGIPISNMGVWSNATPEVAAACLDAKNVKLREYYLCRSQGTNKVSKLYSDNEATCTNFTEEITDEVNKVFDSTNSV